MKGIDYNTNERFFQFEVGDLIYHTRAEEYFIVISDPYYPREGKDWIESGLIRRDVLRIMNMQTSHMGKLGMSACELCGRLENESNDTRNNSKNTSH